MGRGLLTAHPDVVRGTYLGAAGDGRSPNSWSNRTGLLLLGVILSDTNCALSERKVDIRQAMLAIDREVRVGHHITPAIPLDDLVDALLARAGARGVGGRRRRRGRSARWSWTIGVAASDVAAAVDGLVPRHGPMPIAAEWATACSPP